MSRSRNYCFTDFELLDFEKIYKEYEDIIRYICFGIEICPKTKKKHIQGWIQFYDPKRMTRVKNIFGTKRIHIEICRGNEYDNDKYCKKDNNFKEFGKFIKQGYRTDLELLKKSIFNDNVPKNDIIKNNFETYCRYRNGIIDALKIRDEENVPKFRKLYVELICGPTNSGKTRKAMEEATYMINGSELDWWDGYNNDKIICIDEYNNDVKITKLLKILDGYKLRLPIKGSFTYARWNKVYITTNLRPDELHWNAKEEHIKALKRRINKITNLFKDEEE